MLVALFPCCCSKYHCIDIFTYSNDVGSLRAPKEFEVLPFVPDFFTDGRSYFVIRLIMIKIYPYQAL